MWTTRCRSVSAAAARSWHGVQRRLAVVVVVAPYPCRRRPYGISKTAVDVTNRSWINHSDDNDTTAAASTRRMIMMMRRQWSSLSSSFVSSPTVSSLVSVSSSWTTGPGSGAVRTPHSRLLLSSSSSSSSSYSPYTSVHILYASQTGTAQLFARQLQEAVQDTGMTGTTCTMQALSELNGQEWVTQQQQQQQTPADDDETTKSLYLFVISTAGVGEFPDNGRAFYEQLVKATTTPQQQQPQQPSAAAAAAPPFFYALFALGNAQAHPHHYCAAGKALDEALQQQLHAQPVLPLQLGNDGDHDTMLEDVFDTWQDSVVQHIIRNSNKTETAAVAAEESEEKKINDRNAAAAAETDHHPPVVGENNNNKVRTVSSAETVTTSLLTRTNDPRQHTIQARPSLYPPLLLSPPFTASLDNDNNNNNMTDLLDCCPDFYQAGCQRMTLLSNQPLTNNTSSVTGLHEAHIALPPGVTYETGDHLVVYPRNADLLVQAYWSLVKQPGPEEASLMDIHAIVQGPIVVDNTIETTSIRQEQPNGSSSSNNHNQNPPRPKQRKANNYPHPTGISIYQTLSHCVDLEALPSPSFARWLTGKGRDLDYRRDIAQPRRTVLDILLEQPPNETNNGSHQIELSDLLYNLPPLAPRYYSIASSAMVHPDTAYLTYRPIHYYTTRGVARQGLCTSYLQRLKSPTTTCLVAAVRSNPQFRLPPLTADISNSSHHQTTTGRRRRPAPIVLIAGGCGVAPIRAFLEELVFLHGHRNDDNETDVVIIPDVHLFLGFRNPNDQVYQELVDQARDLFLVTCRITFMTGCSSSSNNNNDCVLVSQAMVQEAETLRPLLLSEHDDATAPAHFYVCGGAREFGVAIERALHDILLPEFAGDTNMATERLRELVRQGRLHEDLSD